MVVMKKSECPKGLGVAMVTPFTQGNPYSIDYGATGRLVEHFHQTGVDFIVALGSTGEAATLSPEEQREFVRYVVAKNQGKLPLVVGKSGNNTAALVAELRSMDYTGIDFILSAVPAYNKPSARGMIAHFTAVAEASQRPVILYNVPGRTGVNMTAETTLTLARECPNIVGIKEASGDLNQVAAILAARPRGFTVLSGDDSLTLAMMAMGAEGVISVIGNVLPLQFGVLVHAAAGADLAKAANFNGKLTGLYEALFRHGNPAGVKAALWLQDFVANELRLPLVPIPQEFENTLKDILDLAIERTELL